MPLRVYLKGFFLEHSKYKFFYFFLQLVFFFNLALIVTCISNVYCWLYYRNNQMVGAFLLPRSLSTDCFGRVETLLKG